MEVSLIEAENDSNSNLQSWSLESVTSRKIVFKLEYVHPLKVS